MANITREKTLRAVLLETIKCFIVKENNSGRAVQRRNVNIAFFTKTPSNVPTANVTQTLKFVCFHRFLPRCFTRRHERQFGEQKIITSAVFSRHNGKIPCAAFYVDLIVSVETKIMQTFITRFQTICLSSKKLSLNDNDLIRGFTFC